MNVSYNDRDVNYFHTLEYNIIHPLCNVSCTRDGLSCVDTHSICYHSAKSHSAID